MKEASFISRLLTEPWQIHESRGRTIITSLLQRLRSERPAQDLWGDPLPVMRIEGDVAIIPIVGPMMLNVPDWLKEWGISLTDINDIAEEITSAVNNPGVEIILLDIDSPGGESQAGNKLHDLVASARKKKTVMAWCGDGRQMCSAAFNGALPSTGIYAAKYACVGCVGSYLVALDASEYWKMMGLDWKVFRSGDLKGIGEDAITEQQAAFLQNLVDESGATFRQNVQKYLPDIAREDLEGQWFDGKQAASRGFIHDLAADSSAALRKLRAL